jgi:hypothetical protein
MDRAQELEHLRQAERYIDEAKALIETQREFVRELTQKGQDPEVPIRGFAQWNAPSKHLSVTAM